MSVINQMLKDLESRRQTGGAGNNVLDGIAWHGAGKGSKRAPLLVIIVVVLAAVVGWLVYERVTSEQPQVVSAPSVTVPTPVVEKTVESIKPVATEPARSAEPVKPEVVAEVSAPVPEPIEEKFVGSAAVRPVIFSMLPEPVLASGRRSELTLRGTGFIEPLSVTVTWANGEVSKQLALSQVRVDGDEQIRLFLNPVTRGDNWTVQVSNADGELSDSFDFDVVSSSSSFTTQTPATQEDDDSVVKKPRTLTAEQSAENHYRKASEQVSRGELLEGESGLRKSLQLKTGLHAARELLAGLLLRQKRVLEAAQILDEGLVLSPARSNYILLRSRIYTEQGNITAAISLLESQKPELQAAGDYYALLAALYQRSGRHAAAASLYTRMLKQNPRQAVWNMGLGISQEALGETSLARKSYQRALQSGLNGKDVRNFVKARLQQLN